MKILHRITELLFPFKIKCVFCGNDIHTESRYLVCDECRLSIPYNNGKMCQKCGKPLGEYNCPNCLHTKHYFKMARAPLIYKDTVLRAIHDFKFNNMSDKAIGFAEFIYDTYMSFNTKFDAIVAVPLHSKRLRKRGYNQSHKLLLALNQKIHLTDLSHYVTRVKDTSPQSSLNREDRFKNVKSAFAVVDNQFKDKTILVIDDVVTTMATVNALCKELKSAGAKDIYVLSIAHG